ncbi:MAG TPA: MmpS family transport accessory protein [Jatrophihabitantaceae bacterium]|nr:MmpS family transport accessory protein [Jatrophihabitantaceae bacterium]
MFKQPLFWALCVAVVAIGSVITLNLTTSSSHAKHTVVYSVTGTVHDPTIYYFDESQDAKTLNDQPLPWTKTITVTGNPVGYRAGASVSGSAHGELACSVRIDGKVVATKKASGAGPQVRCVPAQ